MRHLRCLSRGCFCRSAWMQFLPPSQAAFRFSWHALILAVLPRKNISHSAGHSVVTGVLGNKKSRHTNVYRLVKRVNFPLGVLVSHSCNRLWKSKSCFVLSRFRPETKGIGNGNSIFISILLRCRLAPSLKICVNQYSVVALQKGYFIIYRRIGVCQYFPKSFWIFLGEAGNTI